jgi:hypothetical protein
MVCIATAWILIQQSNNTKDDIQQAQAVQVFFRIDDYSHE